MIVIKDNFYIPSLEIDFQFARSSGPGGQNVNKVNSKAILSWQFSENRNLPEGVRKRFEERFSNRINSDGQVIIHSERYRDRPQNIKDCEDKLKEMLLAVWQPAKKRKPTKPTRASKEKRLQAKKGRSETKKNRQKIAY
ncbi:alternative ribosome rescue aminoacyl-tRNA hydrolase ArfB [Pseudobacteriovorax antillogorgiicola]|uniref:Ribosome-associated protein n=1 Tax=Pseudobacteriovorax antillogorgiicola TaxID=1513793 RepID=A0A1Y6BJM6_9BACT|nr:alternative ribosome rescue aminoacyl-tRNA hydrolase ArfB [Pseudobacteriovorax antillogorgiicola]TCS55394.1 ribosome-associated protein [Pseudobacteriovorax antillogorgiicola]SMF13087.1 ribosome-associated protein [Pseudobacteriovorax antillogorgiicola]